MNIWNWIHDRGKTLRKDGHGRLAALMDTLPNHVVELRYPQVDAIAPEGVALARGANDPWLEVFFRHWHLQSRVFSRMEGEGALREAVALVDFAHQPEAEGCPQSVCSVQDLAACYGIVDGPGWAPERIEVTTETLARIDPTWACFECISGEHADALRDQGDPAAALTFLEGQIARRVAQGLRTDPDRFCGISRVSMLIDAGRFDEALALVDRQLAVPAESKNRHLQRRAMRARILARLGRFEDAREALPAPHEALGAPYLFANWAETAQRLVEAGAIPNDPALGRTLATMVTALDKNGAPRTALAVAQRHGELALARGAPWSARRALALMERCVPRLRVPLDALDRVGSLRRAIEELTPAALDVESPEAFLDDLHARQAEAERDLLALDVASARWPDHEELALTRATALGAAGYVDDALGTVESWLAAREPTETATFWLGQRLVFGSDPTRFERFAEDIAARATNPKVRAVPSFQRALRAERDEDWRAVCAELEPVAALWPDGLNVRRMLARARTNLGDPAAALEIYDAIVAREPESRTDHWDRMAAATILEDWAKVRASAAAIGLALDTPEGPIDERWELCFLRDDTMKLREGRVLALRTGPVTARVLYISAPDEPSVYGDVWAFDARPLNEGPAPGADEPTRQRHRWEYRPIARLRRGDFRTAEIEGPRPSSREVGALRERLESMGCAAYVLSTDQYELPDPASPEAFIPAVYLRVAVPPSVTDDAVDEAVREACASFAHPLTVTRANAPEEQGPLG